MKRSLQLPPHLKHLSMCCGPPTFYTSFTTSQDIVCSVVGSGVKLMMTFRRVVGHSFNVLKTSVAELNGTVKGEQCPCDDRIIVE